MKFSHSLQFNAVPEWSSHYIAYSQLKRLIYALQKERLYQSASVDPERVPLQDTYTIRFTDALDKELHKVDRFYGQQEAAIMTSFHDLQETVCEMQRHESLMDLGSRRSSMSPDASPSASSRRRSQSRSPGRNSGPIPRRRSGSLSDNEDAFSSPGSLPARLRSSSGEMAPLMSRNTQLTDLDFATENKINMKKRLVVKYTQLCELKSFIELNQTGFSKICKKFDKSLEADIKASYLASLAPRSHIFKPETLASLESAITDVIGMYARFLTTGNETDQDESNYHEAENELSLHLREHVVWERNTVWKDMINLERKAQNVKAAKKSRTHRRGKTLDENASVSPSPAALPQATLTDALHYGPTHYLHILVQSQRLLRFIALTLVFVFLVLWNPIQDELQKNCSAILVYASLLWATETIPLFVTSLLVPLLIVTLPVLRNTDGEAMTTPEASQYILSTMWSSVIMLLLGGFTLAAALSKYNVAKVISTHVLASAGTNPKIILLTNMCVALFASMWVSNVAAPVLCYSIIEPLLRTLPKKSTFAKSLIMGIALASNIGGIASPIASPQNIISIGMMSPQPSWAQWFAVSLPVCFLCILGIWVILLISFPVDKNLKILQLHPIRDPFTMQQWFVTACTILTIVLWCFAKQLTPIFGEMGIISIIPMFLLFGSGLLTSSDFNNFMWTIVVLAMGGTTLGKAVTSSGLLASIATTIKTFVEDKPVFVIVLIFGIVILVMATFVSHTVAAMIIVPLMAEIGSKLPTGNHSRLLIMVSAMLCSGAMGLPTSGFPNVTAISMLDEVGDRYLTVGNFITRGIPASVLTYGVIVTVGYALMALIGF
ncbi:LAMI_0C01706g1_1 [Lachancea mirantina]|uniref:LAMI_0C01706g1_1 n=1 Tax=Lachancea mirantina TaxID=1230905 RepID=A0A1G4J0I9_9SACH|nr:LAMI_0C01706g1_1 [Lachancea mirantina]